MKEIYKSYDVTALATDPDFIHWVKNPSTADDQSWQKWLKENPDMRPTVTSASLLVKRLSFEERPMNEAADRIWNRIQASTQVMAPSRRRRSRVVPLRFMATAVAAGLALLIYFQFFGTSSMSLITKAGEDIVHQLPDNSQVHLNDGSSVKYTRALYADERVLHLEGEAFFDVRKGAPFRVETEHGTIEVLGTSFNIFSRSDGFEVRCFTGLVKVMTHDVEVLLEPGQAFGSTFEVVSQNSVVHFDQAAYQDWRQGIFHFEDAPIIEVMQELERQFNVAVSLGNVSRQLKYTGFFMSDNLDEALNNICWPLKLNAEKDGDQISIRSN